MNNGNPVNIETKKNSNHYQKIFIFASLSTYSYREQGWYSHQKVSTIYLEKVIMLTQNEIKQITHAAEVLQKWCSYVSKKGSDDLSCHIALLASFETTIDQAMNVLLTKNPKLGQDIKSECDKLLGGAKLVEDLREVNASEACFKEIELLGPARRLISKFQQIAQSAIEELSAETPAETKQENNNAKREREGMIQPKPPEIFQKILWIQKYGRKHWKLVSLAILIVLCIWILSKINLFS